MCYESIKNPGSEPDLYPDLPRLPLLPLAMICEQLQESIGGAIEVVARQKGFSLDRLLEVKSLATGNSATVIEAEIIQLYQDLVAVNPEEVSQYAQILNVPDTVIYRGALFLMQQQGRFEGEVLEDLKWEAERKLRELGDDSA